MLMPKYRIVLEGESVQDVKDSFQNVIANIEEDGSPGMDVGDGWTINIERDDYDND